MGTNRRRRVADGLPGTFTRDDQEVDDDHADNLCEGCDAVDDIPLVVPGGTNHSRGTGSLVFHIRGSHFSGSGDFDQSADPDKDDGFDADEVEAGDLITKVLSSTANDNFGEGSTRAVDTREVGIP
jgi:hypothetical protein